MLDILTDAEVAGALIWEPQVSSWLDGEWLADVPVSSGSVTWSTRREVPGSIELTVPRLTVGADWLPKNNTAHPLARNGQILHASIRVTLPVSRRIVVIRVGTFRITDWEDQGGTVAVTGVSMFRLIENARLRRPTKPRTSGTLASELRRLTPSSLGVVVDDALTDRTCPRMTWGESRMDAIREIATAWPARLRETMYGDVSVLPPISESPDPVWFLHHDEGGTVVSAYPSGSEDGIYNAVIARGTETDDAGAPLIQAEAEQLTGPLRVTGPFGDKPRFFASPLLTSTRSALTAAQTILADSVREAITLPVVCASDPRVELDDAAEVKDEDGHRYWGYVSGYTLPLTYEGNMRVDVEVA